jgi:uncharacterized protein VirK/YbjX
MRNKAKAVKVIFLHLANNSVFSNIRNYWNLTIVLSPFLKLGLITRNAYTKYLYPCMSHGFDWRLRFKTIIHHYSFLNNTYSPIQLKKIFSQGIECFREIYDDATFSITLNTNPEYEYEGPLSFYFKVNNDLISKMSFTFFPGHCVNSDVENTLYITHLQRAPTQEKNNESFYKYFKNIHPSAVLLKAIEAFALTLNIKQIIAITAKNQLNYAYQENLNTFQHTYNDFWQERGGICRDDNYFFTLPLSETPLLDIKQKHRNKTVKRRRRLRDV